MASRDGYLLGIMLQPRPDGADFWASCTHAKDPAMF